MDISNRKEPALLFIGDVVLFYFSLWVTLALRYGVMPDKELITLHLVPFTILFLLWIGIFYVAGLYEKHTLLFKGKLPTTILNAVVVNSLIAVLFFYITPIFGISPKTILFLDLVISFALITLWRLYGIAFLGFRKRENAILVGAGNEMRELRDEVNGNERYRLTFISSVDISQLEGLDFKHEVIDKVYTENVSAVVVDLKDDRIAPVLPQLYNLIFSKVKFVDMYKIYEEVFDRAPLSLVGYNWFIENISFSSRIAYDFLKRLMDIVIAFFLGIISLIFYPFVALAIKLDDGGAVFIVQERIGKGNKIIRLYKFRSMRSNDGGVWVKEDDKRITRVGKFLRKSRIDELPQLFNVLRGDLSLIGPRPDILDLGRKLAKEITYYTVRNLITPGLSGWAQIKQEVPPQSLEETKMRLSYDLFYIKNRSFMLDLGIALKTVKTLLSRTGK